MLDSLDHVVSRITDFYIDLICLELKKEKRAQEKMMTELKKMQEKLLIGGVTIQESTNNIIIFIGAAKCDAVL